MPDGGDTIDPRYDARYQRGYREGTPPARPRFRRTSADPDHRLAPERNPTERVVGVPEVAAAPELPPASGLPTEAAPPEARPAIRRNWADRTLLALSLAAVAVALLLLVSEVLMVEATFDGPDPSEYVLMHVRSALPPPLFVSGTVGVLVWLLARVFPPEGAASSRAADV